MMATQDISKYLILHCLAQMDGKTLTDNEINNQAFDGLANDNALRLRLAWLVEADYLYADYGADGREAWRIAQRGYEWLIDHRLF